MSTAISLKKMKRLPEWRWINQFIHKVALKWRADAGFARGVEHEDWESLGHGWFSLKAIQQEYEVRNGEPLFSEDPSREFILHLLCSMSFAIEIRASDPLDVQNNDILFRIRPEFIRDAQEWKDDSNDLSKSTKFDDLLEIDKNLHLLESSLTAVEFPIANLSDSFHAIDAIKSLVGFLKLEGKLVSKFESTLITLENELIYQANEAARVLEITIEILINSTIDRLKLLRFDLEKQFGLSSELSQMSLQTKIGFSSEETRSRFAQKAHLLENYILELKNAVVQLEKSNQDLRLKIKEVPLNLPSTSLVSNYYVGQYPSLDSSLPEDIISNIRLEKGFFLQDSPDLDIRASLKSLYRSLDSAIEKLSSDIYSSPSRFLMELLQNADDNSYADEQEPAFSLGVDLIQGYICTKNNEIGFSKEDVYAICEVGGSTKTSCKRSIGNKGIGFKSVFGITDTPHVLSNGFRFFFDCTQPLGYLLPLWITDLMLQEILNKMSILDVFDLEKGTYMYLPLRKSVDVIQSFAQELQDSFSEIGFTLLFLRNVRRLKIQLRTMEAKVVTRDIGVIKRCSHLSANQFVEDVQILDTGSGIKKVADYDFKVYKTSINIPSSLASSSSLFRNNKMGNVCIEIALAFPSIPMLLPVYSFLPVGHAGFKFIIHSEFELTSSREAIHFESQVNLFIRDQIAKVLKEAIFHIPLLRENLLEFLPSQSEILSSFWNPVVVQFQHLVRNLEFLKGASGKSLMVNQVCISSSRFQSVFTNDELWMSCGLEYIHSDFLSSTSSTNLLQSKLGIPKTGIDQILKILSFMDFSQKESDWFDKLFLLLYEEIMETRNSTDCFHWVECVHIKSLKTIPIFRIDGLEKTVSLASLEDPVFYLSDADRSRLSNYSLGIYPYLLSRFSFDLTFEISKFLEEMLGIQRLTFKILTTFIQSDLSDEKRLVSSGCDILNVWEQLRFLKDNYYSQLINGTEYAILPLLIPCRCLNGSKSSKLSVAPSFEVHLVSNEVITLASTLGISGCFVEEPLVHSNSSKLSWEDFLIKCLGVRAYFPFDNLGVLLEDENNRVAIYQMINDNWSQRSNLGTDIAFLSVYGDLLRRLSFPNSEYSIDVPVFLLDDSFDFLPIPVIDRANPSFLEYCKVFCTWDKTTIANIESWLISNTRKKKTCDDSVYWNWITFYLKVESLGLGSVLTTVFLGDSFDSPFVNKSKELVYFGDSEIDSTLLINSIDTSCLIGKLKENRADYVLKIKNLMIHQMKIPETYSLEQICKYLGLLKDSIQNLDAECSAFPSKPTTFDFLRKPFSSKQFNSKMAFFFYIFIEGFF